MNWPVVNLPLCAECIRIYTATASAASANTVTLSSRRDCTLCPNRTQRALRVVIKASRNGFVAEQAAPRFATTDTSPKQRRDVTAPPVGGNRQSQLSADRAKQQLLAMDFVPQRVCADCWANKLHRPPPDSPAPGKKPERCYRCQELFGESDYPEIWVSLMSPQAGRQRK